MFPFFAKGSRFSGARIMEDDEPNPDAISGVETEGFALMADFFG
jgi:hypothetical protein